MAFGESIIAYFGGDTSGLKRACGEAAAEVDKLNTRMGSRLETKLVSSLFGIAAINAVRNWASEAIKGAQETRDEFEKLHKPLDATTRSLAGFGDGLAGLKSAAVISVGWVIAQFNHAGEAAGSLINRIRGISKAQEEMAMAGVRAFAAEETAIAKAREENSPEKLMAAEAKLNEARRAAQLARFSDEGKLTLLKVEQLELERNIAAAKLNSVDRIELQTRYEKNVADIEKLQLSLLKQQNAETAKGAEASNRVNDEYYALQMRKRGLALAEMSDEERLIALKQDEAQLVQGIAAVGDKSKTGIELSNTLLDTQADIRTTNLSITEAQATAEGKIVESLKTQGGLMAGIRGGNQFNEASTATLQDVAQRDRAQAAKLLNPAFGPGNFGTQIEAGRLNLEAQNAERIVADRQKLGRAYQTGGVEAARRAFQGDPLLFDKVMQQVLSTYGTEEKLLDEARRINTQLQKFTEPFT
jgi:hypothetical protein